MCLLLDPPFRPPLVVIDVKPMLGRSLLVKTGFWPSYCQIPTGLDTILHTPVLLLYSHRLSDDVKLVIRNTLVDRLRPRSAAPGQTRTTVFVILVTHPKSYIETTDRRDFGSKPSKWR